MHEVAVNSADEMQMLYYAFMCIQHFFMVYNINFDCTFSTCACLVVETDVFYLSTPQSMKVIDELKI